MPRSNAGTTYPATPQPRKPLPINSRVGQPRLLPSGLICSLNKGTETRDPVESAALREKLCQIFGVDEDADDRALIDISISRNCLRSAKRASRVDMKTRLTKYYDPIHLNYD